MEVVTYPTGIQCYPLNPSENQFLELSNDQKELQIMWKQLLGYHKSIFWQIPKQKFLFLIVEIMVPTRIVFRDSENIKMDDQRNVKVDRSTDLSKRPATFNIFGRFFQTSFLDNLRLIIHGQIFYRPLSDGTSTFTPPTKNENIKVTFQWCSNDWNSSNVRSILYSQ